MEYAPVIIPTLNRYKHLERCLDSLSKNRWANLTEVYISVDYPPSEKYAEGHRKVLALLKSYDFSAFKDIHVIYQDQNLGAKGNSDFLYSLVRRNNNCVIYSEDDNEFSPNFIEYIDKCLEFFKDDPNIVFICGATDVNWVSQEGADIIKTKFCPSYGLGIFLQKMDLLIAEGKDFLLSRNNWTFSTFYRLFRRNKFLFSKYICEILLANKGLFWLQDGELNFCDTVISIYLHLSDYYSITPVIPVSRTFGNDGSGVNMPVLKQVVEKPIDDNSFFNMSVPNSFNFDYHNYRIGERFLCDQYLGGRKWTSGIVLSVIGSLILLITGRNRKRAIRIMNMIYKMFRKDYYAISI